MEKERFVPAAIQVIAWAAEDIIRTSPTYDDEGELPGIIPTNPTNTSSMP